MQHGNGRWDSTVFNSRLQPTQIALGATQRFPPGLSPSLVQAALNRGIVNPNIYAQLEVDFAAGEAKAIFRGLASATTMLGAHLAKLNGLQYKSSVERTIQNVSNQITTILQFIKDKGL